MTQGAQSGPRVVAENLSLKRLPNRLTGDNLLDLEPVYPS